MHISNNSTLIALRKGLTTLIVLFLLQKELFVTESSFTGVTALTLREDYTQKVLYQLLI